MSADPLDRQVMTDEEILDGYVKHVNRVPVPALPTSREEFKRALALLDAALDDDPFFWAWEEVTDLIDSDPERAWILLIQTLVRCTAGHEHIIGAGPLEELLVKYPRQFAERTAIHLVSDQRFQEAFAVINFSTEYCSVSDAEFFNDILEAHGMPSDMLPLWRIAEPDEAV